MDNDETDVHRIIATAFTTLDGVAEDPAGSFGSPVGGWALPPGPAPFAGDQFRCGGESELRRLPAEHGVASIR